MDNENSFDWLALQTQAPGKTFTDLYNVGATPDNTTLQEASFYKDSPKMKDMFKTADGGFDEDKFQQYYQNAQTQFNDFHKADLDLGNVTTDLWNDTGFARKAGVAIRKNPIKVSLTSDDPFSSLKTAQKSFFGLTEVNKWTMPKKTISEVAQGQQVRDATGKELGFTPEDHGGILGLFRDPLALAQYDEDILDAKGNVTHKRGELKYDDKGLPYYETLDGRDPSSRQLLSKWTTLTKEDSFLNKFDVMDDDGMNKTITGTIVKSAVKLAPLLLGAPVSSAYLAYYVSTNLLSAGAEIGKSIDGLLNNDKTGSFYKFANTLQGYVKQQDTSISDYGKDHFFSLENLAAQAVDSVYQLMSQRAIAKWPVDIAKYKMAKELGLAEGSALKATTMSAADGEAMASKIFQGEHYLAKYGNDLGAAAEALSKNMQQLEKYQKYSHHFATAYMAATSAEGIAQASEQAGLNARDKAWLYLGYTAGMAKLFDVYDWVEKVRDLDKFAKTMNNTLTDYSSKYFPSISARMAEQIGEGTAKQKAFNLVATGKKLGEMVVDKMKNWEVSSYLGAAGSEATEEFTEQSLQYALQGLYDSFANNGIVAKDDKARFNLTSDEVLTGLGSNALGGALGGLIFHGIETKLDPHSHALEDRDYAQLITDGHAPQMIKQVEKLRQAGQLGSTTLSTNLVADANNNTVPGVFKPVNKDNPKSQNDVIADRLTKTIRTHDVSRLGFNIQNATITAENKNHFYAAIVDTRTDTDLRDQIYDTAQKLYNVYGEISTLSEGGDEAKEGLAAKQIEMTELKSRLEYLQGDESLDEFFRQGLFNIRRDINAAFGVKTKDSFAKQVNPLAHSYDSLSGQDKVKADALYEEYRNAEGPGSLRADLWEARKGEKGYDVFNKNLEEGGYSAKMELYKESLKTLHQYVNLQQTTYKPSGDPVSEVSQIVLQTDFLKHLQNVTYIPDYMYDTIERRINNFQSKDAEQYLNILAPEPTKLKAGILDNLDSLDIAISQPVIRDFLNKTLGGETFIELINSPEVRDLRENREASSNYSLLATLKKLTNFNDDPKTLELRNVRKGLKAIDEDTAYEILTNYDEVLARGEHPEIMQYLEANKFRDYLERMQESGLSADDLVEFTEPKDLLNNMLLINHMDDLTGKKMSIQDNVSLVQSPKLSDNFVLGLIIDGKYGTNGNVLLTNSLRQQDTRELDENVMLAKDFKKTKVSSPLADMLKDTNDFVNSEYQTLDQVGYTNYMNNSPAFVAGLEYHMNELKRLRALIEATVSINPLVNDFRKHNKAGLDTDLSNLQLIVMSSEDASHLTNDLNMLANKITHLQEVNDYNRNNILAKMLKESGLDLASKFQTLKTVAANVEVAELLPSLAELFQLPHVLEYTSTLSTASNELRNIALYEMAKFEENLHADFQRLDADKRNRVINLTFKPVNVDSSKFYEAVDGIKPYNDFTSTLYLAKVYGSSTIDFYKRYAGLRDADTKLFANLEKLKYAPFTSQEDAMRLAHLYSTGDRNVIARLFNAYATEPNDEGVYDFTTSDSNTFESHSMMVVWGDPGVGKTSAVATGMINMLSPDSNDVLLLAPKARQVTTLKNTMADSGFSDRIDATNSKIFRDFLKSMNLKTKDGKSYDVDTHDDKVEFFTEEGSPVSVQKQFRNLFLNETKGILPNLDLYKDKSDTTYTLSDSINHVLSRYKMIIVDEYTWINPIDLGLLSKLVDQYNGSSTVQKDPSKRITIAALGDVNQLGYIGKDGGRRTFTDVTKAVVSQPLTTSLRSGWDVVNNTLIDLRNRAVKYKSMSKVDLAKTDTITESRQTPIKANYVEDAADGNKGIKVVNKSGDATVADISFIGDNRNKLTTKEVVYVVKTHNDIPKAQALLKESLGDNWATFADIYTPTEVQGGEYKYAIIDAMPDLPTDDKTDAKVYNLKRVHEFLNTMLSRGTEATVFLNDGSIKDYVTFDSQLKPKAIRQIKLDDQTIKDIKADKQALLAQILQDVTGEITAPAGGPSPEAREKQGIPIVSVGEIAPLFEEPITEARVYKPGGADLTSSNHFSTIEDYDKVFGLLPDLKASDRSKAETVKRISMVINSYKYYLLHKDELGDRQISLRSNFETLFSDNRLDWETPSYYIEVHKRGDKGMNEGRTELNTTFVAKPSDIVISLKLRIPNVDEDDKSLDLTMGYLNNIEDLAKRDALKVNLGGALDENLFANIKNFINENADAPQLGQHVIESKNNRWISPVFDEDTFKSMSQIFGSRIIYEDAKPMEYDTLRDQYFDFAISDPQVVVANLYKDNNTAVLDPKGTNADYRDYWEKLKGKSIAFISEIYEFNALSPREMLDIYIKQISYFNTPEFKALDNDGKKQFIDDLEDNIKLPSGLEVKYKPNLIKMLKMDNPTSDFLDFRERFLAAVAMKSYGAKMTTDLLEKFNTSLYVKDRLVKSLLTLQQFLKEKSGRAWFEENVITKQNQRASDWLEEVYKDAARLFNEGEPVDRKLFTVNELALKRSGPINLKEFKDMLDDLLDPGAEESIYRGIYSTQTDEETGEPTSRKVYRADIDTRVTPEDLKLNLSGNKNKDFAGKLIDVKLFNLFKRTKNVNFADLIDLSLKALASFENKSDFRKYDLSRVFKDGKIESVIIASQPGEGVDRASNVLATAIKTAGDFTFDLGKITHPSYNIDFTKLINVLKGETTVTPVTPTVDTQGQEVTDETTVAPEVKAPAKVVELNDTVVDPSVPHRTTVRDRLLKELPNITDIAGIKPDQVEIDPMINTATLTKASFMVTLPNGVSFEMTYDMENDTVKTTPVSPGDGTTDAKVTLQNIEKIEMQNYDKMIEDMFGTKATQPALKVALDSFRQTFRFAMLGSNLESMNADFNIVDYDPEFKGYSEDVATDTYTQHVTDNANALRPFIQQLRNISKYINAYKPNIC